MKKLIASAMTFFLAFSTCAYAYSFPTPDWGALLNERKNMVTQSEFELYTEGSVNSAPYYGARLEPGSGTYIGMIAETSEGFTPLGSYLTYIQDMYQDDLYYPANAMIKSDNVIPMIGWTISDINNVNYDQVRRVLDTLNTYNKPMYIRFANEMNVSPLGDEPDRYIQVFRTVANMIHEYPNFAVVWSPNDIGALDRPFEYFYPGDEYVDWIGVSCYSIRYFLGNKDAAYKDTVYFMTGDYAWATNRLKPITEFMAKYNINKPIMISEGGVATNNSYGDYQDAWAAPRLRNMLWYVAMKYPQVKMINYFNTYRASETERFDISNYQYAADIFREAAGSGAYIREAGARPDFVFQPADKGETLAAKDGIVRLYTLAYFAGKPDITVNYSIDDVWYHSSNQIPYTCGMKISDISDGQHTLTIRTDGAAKTYTFYKRGQCIRFGVEPDAAAVQQSNSITVTLNGVPLSFDQPPVLQNGRTLVPLRVIFEALGAEVLWNEDTQTIISTKGEKTVTLTVGSNILYTDGRAVTLDVPAQIINGRTLVPVRAVAESFDCGVDWNDAAQTVVITYAQ